MAASKDKFPSASSPAACTAGSFVDSRTTRISLSNNVSLNTSLAMASDANARLDRMLSPQIRAAGLAASASNAPTRCNAFPSISWRASLASSASAPSARLASRTTRTSLESTMLSNCCTPPSVAAIASQLARSASATTATARAMRGCWHADPRNTNEKKSE